MIREYSRPPFSFFGLEDLKSRMEGRSIVALNESTYLMVLDNGRLIDFSFGDFADRYRPFFPSQTMFEKQIANKKIVSLGALKQATSFSLYLPNSLFYLHAEFDDGSRATLLQVEIDNSNNISSNALCTGIRTVSGETLLIEARGLVGLAGGGS